MAYLLYLMVLASISMIRGTHDYNNDDERFMPVLLIVQGMLIGFLTGLVGAGGGFLIVPALVLLTGLGFKTAVGTSLFIIAINSLTGFLGDLMNYSMDWSFLLIITTARNIRNSYWKSTYSPDFITYS